MSCKGQGAGTVSESISKARTPPNAVLADQECELCLRLPNTSAMDLLVSSALARIGREMDGFRRSY